MNIKFDQLLSKIDNVLQKRRVKLNNVSIIRLKSSISQQSRNATLQLNITTLRNDKQQC